METLTTEQQHTLSLLAALGVRRYTIGDEAALTADERRRGYTHVVIDGAHSSDGGPVAIAYFRKPGHAERYLRDLGVMNATS